LRDKLRALVALIAMLAAAVNPAVVQAAQEPFQIVYGVPVVNVWINHRGPFRFVVDSGATWTIVSPQLARRLGLTVVARRRVSGAGADQLDADELVLGSVNAGGAELHRVVAYSVKLPPALVHPQDAAGVDGLLGETFFHAFVTTLDYETSMIAFSDPRRFTPPRDAIALAMRMVAGDAVPAVPVVVDGKKTYFELDTGSGNWPVITHAFTAQGITEPFASGSEQTAQGAGGSYSVRSICAQSFELGTARFAHVQMWVQPQDLGITAEGDFGGSFGYNILRDFTVSLDFANHTAYFERNLMRPMVSDDCSRTKA